ncbi:MAG: VWA domain-containing protein [Ruminococcaceae bacterium]|nr:VWA domain-containing protein [Oscillospiraceae bacterium]
MKRIVSVALLLVLLIGLIGTVPSAQAQTATIRNRKIVSVVYDDSGSMDGEKWEYTSYAMQCFAAMLNKVDRLDITYMSSYQQGSFRVDTDNRVQSVQQIRDHTDRSGKTPVEAVQTGFDTLASVTDSNPNTEYWLIVMTDGKMSGAEEKINKLADERMPNGSKPHIVFLTLCDTTGEYTPSFSKENVESRSARTADEIISVISDLSDDIAGRFAAAPIAIKSVSDTVVEVTTDLPLFNMGILSQRSTAQIVSVTGRDGTGLVSEGNVPVKAPDKFLHDLSADVQAALNGNVALFSAPSGNIKAGTYTVTFSEPVKAENLVAMFEPAFDLRLELTVDGVVVTDPAKLQEGQILNVQAVLYETGTDNKIAMGMLPGEGKSYIYYSENDQKLSEDHNALRLSNLEMKPVTTEISATLTIPGFFTVSDTIRFRPLATVLSGMSAQLYYDGSERMTDENGQPDPDNVVYITSMDTNRTGIAFTLFVEGQPIGKEEAEARKDAFIQRLSLDFPNYEVAVTEDGKYIVYPTDHGMLDLAYACIYQGSHTVSCTYDGFTAGGELIFKIGDTLAAHIAFFMVVFWILLFLYLIWWIFFKPHFKPGLIRTYQTTVRNGAYIDFGPGTKRIHYLASCGLLNFIGPRGMRKRLGGIGLAVRATAGGGYRVEGVKGKRVSTGVQYPNTGVAVCSEHFFDFDNTVYIFDNAGNYYKISVN